MFQMMFEITKVLDDAAKNEEVNFVILTGCGDYYSSGADMSLDANLEDENSSAMNLQDRLTTGR